MENDPLGLGGMPAIKPPESLWTAISGELDAAETAARRSKARKRWISLAAAASLSLVVVVVGLLNDSPISSPGSSTPDRELAQARSDSARLEQLLRQRRDGVLDAASVEMLVWMEHELGWLDMQLADRPDEADLWRQRADLLGQMTRHYESNSWQAEIQLASY